MQGHHSAEASGGASEEVVLVQVFGTLFEIFSNRFVCVCAFFFWGGGKQKCFTVSSKMATNVIFKLPGTCCPRNPFLPVTDIELCGIAGLIGRHFFLQNLV